MPIHCSSLSGTINSLLLSIGTSMISILNIPERDLHDRKDEHHLLQPHLMGRSSYRPNIMARNEECRWAHYCITVDDIMKSGMALLPHELPPLLRCPCPNARNSSHWFGARNCRIIGPSMISYLGVWEEVKAPAKDLEGRKREEADYSTPAAPPSFWLKLQLQWHHKNQGWMWLLITGETNGTWTWGMKTMKYEESPSTKAAVAEKYGWWWLDLTISQNVFSSWLSFTRICCGYFLQYV